MIRYGRRPDGRELPSVGLELATDRLERQPIGEGRGNARVDESLKKLDRTLEAAQTLRAWLGAKATSADMDPELERKLRETGYLMDGEKRE